MLLVYVTDVIRTDSFLKGGQKIHLNWRERKKELRSSPETKLRCSNLENKLFDENESCYQIKAF